MVASSSGRTERTSRRAKALLLSPVVVLFASAARLLIISNYDTTTATTMAASSGVVGTLLGTVVPLLPLFLPAILVFFIIFRRWGLVLLTAFLTALVSPAYISSVVDGLKIAANSARDIWRGLLEDLPGLHGIVPIARTIRRWLEDILDLILVLPEIALGFIGIELSGNDLRSVWNEWPLSVRVVAICTLAALLWAVYAPPWNYGSRTSLQDEFLPRLPLFIGVVAGTLSTAIRALGIVAYGVCVAATCGFFVLYIQTVYKFPFDAQVVSEILRRPWLPAEEIRLSSGDTLVAYTMTIGNGWHVLLNERTRTISYVRAAEVLERTVCHVTEPTEPIPSPLIQLEGVAPGDVPICSRV